jgi:hypothetical protein
MGTCSERRRLRTGGFRFLMPPLQQAACRLAYAKRKAPNPGKELAGLKGAKAIRANNGK